MTTPHRWAEVIKAWADGKTVQYRYGIESWADWLDNWAVTPCFQNRHLIWRVKPGRRSLWINIYPYEGTSKGGRWYNTKAEADNNALSNRIDCIEYVYKE